MKNSTKTQLMLKALDIELQKLLSQDLKTFKAKQSNIQGNVQQAA